MNKRMFEDKSLNERLSLLRANADKVELMTYAKRLEADQLNQIKESLVDLNVNLSALVEDKKEYVKSANAEIKPIKKEMARIISLINSQTEQVEEECYKFIDQEEGMVAWYNEQGDLITSRRIYPNERQLQIKAVNQS